MGNDANGRADGVDFADQLARVTKLHAQGVLSDDELQSATERLMSANRPDAMAGGERPEEHVRPLGGLASGEETRGAPPTPSAPSSIERQGGATDVPQVPVDVLPEVLTEPEPKKKNVTVKVVAIVVAGLVALSVVGAIALTRGGRDTTTVIEHADGTTSTIQEDDWVSGATVMEAADELVATDFCQATADGASQGLTGDQLFLAFENAWNDSGMGSDYPGVTPDMVFTVAVQKCIDMGY